MEFKVVGKSLILTNYSHKITEGENAFDTVEIAIPRYHDDCDLSALSFRFSETSENGENSAVQVLYHTKCDEKYIYLKGMITSDFTAITGKVIFMLIGVSGENVVAKFQSTPYTISDDISLTSLPNATTAEQLFNQTQLEVQKAIDAANRAEIASQTPAPAEIYTATAEQLGGVLSGNDIFVGDDGAVTVNSVNGKTLGKSVPADAVFTDTVYTLPKATNATIGGVKVDGTTITASSDGTISAPYSENLKNDIKNTNALAVQIAHPNNFLIYDNAGKPSVMVAIPKFYLDEVIDGASHTVHPAFIINGAEQDVIYISKYQNIVENGRAYSLPMQKPQTYITFDQAYDYCKAKGAGWHLMTNAEWAAIALWCQKNGTMPKGNNNYGKDISETNLPQKAAAATKDSDGKINQILTGSGPESWYHNGTFAGIADFNGNEWEWYSGLRTVNLEIQILSNNDAADWNNSVSADSAAWKAIMPDGTLAAPGTYGTIKYSEQFRNTNFQNISVTPVVSKDVSVLLESLAIIPLSNSSSEAYGGATVWLNISNDAVPCRGGRWTSTAYSMLATDFDNTRNTENDRIGFRCAYYGNF